MTKPRTFKVMISQSSIDATYKEELDVLSHTGKAGDALNLVRDEVIKRIDEGDLTYYPTMISTVGPKGGKYQRFLGWDSLVWELMSLNHEPRLFTKQPELELMKNATQ